jgi:hypothetical protein
MKINFTTAEIEQIIAEYVDEKFNLQNKNIEVKYDKYATEPFQIEVTDMESPVELQMKSTKGTSKRGLTSAHKPTSDLSGLNSETTNRPENIGRLPY